MMKLVRSIGHRASGIGHRASGIGHRASGIGHGTSGIGHGTSGSRRSLISALCMSMLASIAQGQTSVTVSASGPAVASEVVDFQMAEAPDDSPYLNPFVEMQQAVLQATLGVMFQSNLTVFELSRSAGDPWVISSSQSGSAVIQWSTVSAVEYDPVDLPFDHPYRTQLLQSGVRTWGVLGYLDGPAAKKAVIGIAIDLPIDDQGNSKHFVIPFVLVDGTIEQTIQDAQSDFERLVQNAGPCTEDMYCDRVLRGRMSSYLDSFVQCLKSNASPISEWNAACFAACVASWSFGVPGYLACVATCNGAVTIGSLLGDVWSCTQIVQAQRDNAKQSYCACLKYQETHCPNMAEPDTQGCP